MQNGSSIPFCICLKCLVMSDHRSAEMYFRLWIRFADRFFLILLVLIKVTFKNQIVSKELSDIDEITLVRLNLKNRTLIF